jgi:hypothetical protein
VKLKRTGTLPGVADLVIPIPNKKYHCCFIELKAGKNKQQDSQKEFQKVVEKFGNYYALCYSVDEFMKTVNNYFNNNL